MDIKEKGNRENIPVLNLNEIVDLQVTVNHLNQERKEELINVIKKYSSVFAKNKYDVGRVRNYEAYITLLENKYISKKPYRCSLPDQKEIEEQIVQLLNAKLIEESNSPFAAPVTLTFKKEDGRIVLHFCIRMLVELV